MKKKLEADLISIAHRILQLKNKSDINQLYLETQKLYEKLSVLRFVEEHFSDAKPTIGRAEIDREIEVLFDKKDLEELEEKASKKDTTVEEIAETTPSAEAKQDITEEKSTVEVQETTTEKLPLEENSEEPDEQTKVIALENDKLEENDVEKETAVNPELQTEEETSDSEDTFTPAFELSQVNEVETELQVPKKTEAVQISFEDLLGGNYHDTLFVKKQQADTTPTAVLIDTPEEETHPEKQESVVVPAETPKKLESKVVSLNEKLATGITIDLNDRLAFIKHLFGNSSEDYNRVLSQLITFDTFYETRDFVQEMVKPDYNNWEGKQDYEDRFMDIIEKKFL